MLCRQNGFLLAPWLMRRRPGSLLSPTGHVGEVLMMSSGDGFPHTFTHWPIKPRASGRAQLQERSPYNQLAETTPCNGLMRAHDGIEPSLAHRDACVCVCVCVLSSHIVLIGLGGVASFPIFYIFFKYLFSCVGSQFQHAGSFVVAHGLSSCGTQVPEQGLSKCSARV